MIKLKDILKEAVEERDQAMVNGVADIVRRVKDSANRKDIAMKMLTKFDTEGVKYDKDSFLKLCGVTEAQNEICEDCWKGYTAVGVKEKNGKTVPNCVPKNEDINLPMLQKPSKPTKPKISKPKFGGTKKKETDADRIRRATAKLDISKKNLAIARTPRQKTQVQRRIQKQYQRLTKMKQKAATKS